MSRVSALRGLVLATPNLAAARAFYTGIWGLDEIEADGAASASCAFFRGRGPEPWVFGLERGEAARLLRVLLAVAGRKELDALHEALVRTGQRVQGPPALLPGPGGYHGFTVLDPDGRALELSTTEHAAPASPRGVPAPLRTSHVVLNSPQARPVVEWYVRHLGLQVSDRYENDGLIFLRCNRDHHCLGIGQGSNTRVNHQAFLLDDEAAVLAAGRAAVARGAQALWGPGRHGPGGNVFHYFRDPDDNVVEYTAELIQVPDDGSWQAKEWQRTPANANVWGTGGPSPQAIALMNGPAETP
jgi:catechol 2,3-dioxygenase-like lactoylglutathione lyase family enzyme